MEEVQSIRLAGATLEKHRHVCAFFASRDDEDAIMLPFIKDGIDRGEKAFHIVDPALRDDHLRRLALTGIDVATAEASGQLEVLIWADAYLREGHFDQNAMLALLEEVLQRGTAEGFPLTRLVAHMEWALEDRPGVDDVIEYESRLNYVLPRYKDPVV